ncbi:glycoside hydrolase family 97 catalytic domain-containing protein [Roseibacillus ishigakijimensis]|uniref:Glycoside hydrolase family 97 catalytic domain-containing protein n=1 Tax=Roseibacillus ishigakijimensis TaxID=454146 RepID=A0A934RS91_9BACT|nr:glycoside hydrolase family 97 catalytic domain-containing protein [Roseibacillus ishigakijimensis]
MSLSFLLNTEEQPFYSAKYQDLSLLLPSRLGLTLQGFQSEGGYEMTATKPSEHQSTWQPVLGEQAEIEDHYHQVSVTFSPREGGSPDLTIEARCYDEGFAFRYRLSQPGDFTITDEATEFTFAGDYPLWSTREVEGDYHESKLSDLSKNRIRPIVIEIPEGPFVALGEAALVDSARMRFQPAAGKKHTVRPHLAGPIRARDTFVSPWRYVMVGANEGELIENKTLVPNLNEPCALADTSWIRPGKAIRAELATDQAKACVDVAVKMNFQHLLLDAGWYGPERSNASDATTVTVDPNRSHGDFDLPEIIRYAKENGIGVFLYVNRRALEKQLDTLLPLYKEWGISGIKFGFVNVGSQEWTIWLHEAIKKCAEHELMVDVHDHYLPTGWSRTYPNLLTQEGIGGNEQMPTAEHNVNLAYTRYLCGAGDYTICYYSGRLQTTRAHQIAASVVYYSPLQLIFWYDKPQTIRFTPELDLFREVPVTWDETRFVEGEIGEYVALARRKGERWFIGVLNSQREREVTLDLDFLREGTNYQTQVFADGEPVGEAPKKVACSSLVVDRGDKLTAKMARNGGAAFLLTPRSE